MHPFYQLNRLCLNLCLNCLNCLCLNLCLNRLCIGLTLNNIHLEVNLSDDMGLYTMVMQSSSSVIFLTACFYYTKECALVRVNSALHKRLRHAGQHFQRQIQSNHSLLQLCSGLCQCFHGWKKILQTLRTVTSWVLVTNNRVVYNRRNRLLLVVRIRFCSCLM